MERIFVQSYILCGLGTRLKQEKGGQLLICNWPAETSVSRDNLFT